MSGEHSPTSNIIAAICFFAPSPSLTGLRCHPLSLWHFANAPSDALKCSLLRFLSACSVNGRHWRRMLTIDTWQALNAFIEAVIAASCLVASVGECRGRGRSHLIRGCRGLAPCWGMGGAKPLGLNCVGYFWEMNTSGGHYDTPTCIQCVEFEREKSRFLLLAFMYAVKNGYHAVRSFSFEKHQNRTFAKLGLQRKSIFCQSLCSLNCVAWLYINFSNHRKPVSPEGANLLPVMVAEHMSLEKLISAPSGKATQFSERSERQSPEGVHGVSWNS